MFITDDVADLRLNSPDNLVNKLQLRDLHSNRNGAKQIPPMIQTYEENH